MVSLAEIFRRHGPDYRARFAHRMPRDQLRAMRDIAQCRTPILGGQVWRCPRCGERRFAFHSCGNRHCPACGGDDAHRWLVRQQSLQLPVTYHLSTFTVPEALRAVIRSHPRQGLALLFHASSSTLLNLCADPRGFGATPGLTGVLHTWTRQGLYHPHVHYLVTGGGLAPDGSWREAEHRFLVPVLALSRVFRARFRDGLRRRLPQVFASIPADVWTQDWVVHSKPVGSGEHALRYLARYIYRVVLSPAAILDADDRTVRFRYRDSETGKSRVAKLKPEEFIRRFLQHVLPTGFVKVRYFGLHHPVKRRTLALVRAALCLRQGRPLPPPPAEPEPWPCLCSVCATPMLIIERLQPRDEPFARAPPATG